jgi:hypothetical protein
MMDKQILANFDDQGIFVYQAFKPSIAEEAVRFKVLRMLQN